MGQYWIPVNLDKREYICPHQLGAGLKLWEQLANHPGTGAALILLCAAQRGVRGGGDLDMEPTGTTRSGLPEHNASPGPMPEDYPAVAARTVGRWAGDRIALVGDYAEAGDLAPEHQADLIYHLCSDHSPGDREETARHWEDCAEKYGQANPDYAPAMRRKAAAIRTASPYTDITADVCRVLEHELCGQFQGDGWRDFVRDP